MSDEPKDEPDVEVAQKSEGPEDFLRRFLDLHIVSLWADQYKKLDNAVTRDALTSMKAMLYEFVTPAQYKVIIDEITPGAIDKWIEQLLMMQRVYEYLMIGHAYSQHLSSEHSFPDAKTANRKWLRELCWNREFRIVHIRQGGFYATFARHLNEILVREARRAETFAKQCDDYQQNLKNMGKEEESKEMKEEAREMWQQTEDMRHCARAVAGILRYEEFIESEQSDPEEYNRLLRLAESHGFLPLTQDNFVKFWFQVLEELERNIIPAEDVTAH